MGDHSSIEWTDATWGPVVGCSRVSPGCGDGSGGGCYAERLVATRLRGVPVYTGLTEDGEWTGEVRTLPERLEQPLRWRKPRRVFVCSMSDLFHADVPDGFISQVFGVMWMCGGMRPGQQPHRSIWPFRIPDDPPRHTFQVLTKRPQRMADLLTEWRRGGWSGLGANVWLGTSIESDRYTFRADHLRRTPAAVRFLSCEPLLGPLPSLDLEGIGWVIVGGESGPRARPLDVGWVRDIRDQCREAGVPLFVKQLGTAWSIAEGYGKTHGGNVDWWPVDLQVREWPVGSAAA